MTEIKKHREQEQIYQDIKKIAKKYFQFGKSDFALTDRLISDFSHEVVESCLKNKYFEVRYY